MMSPDGTAVYTGAALRRLRPGRGPARLLPIRLPRPVSPAPTGLTPARSAAGRYLYTLPTPLPATPTPCRPAPLDRRREVG